MKPSRILSVAAMVIVALALFATAACKSSGMAVTTRGQFLKINISHPDDLPDSGEDSFTVDVGNRGVNNIDNVLVDVEVPTQLVVIGETHGRGVDMTHDAGTNVYHYSISRLNPAESSKMTYRVRTSFGTYSQTDSIKVTAWQRDLPGDKLVETAVIKLRK